MDWSDSDSDSDNFARRPRPVREMPRRAAKNPKAKEPVRLTRASAAHLSGSQSSDDEAHESPDDEVALDGGASNDHHSDSETESDTDDDDDDRDFVAPSKGRKRGAEPLDTLASKRPRRSTRDMHEETTVTTPRPYRPQRKSPTKLAKQQVRESEEPQFVLTGNWGTLPYLIWLQIFEFVAGPVRDAKSRSEDISLATKTLLAAARASKVLAEPALSALYKCPHITPGGALILTRQFGLPQDATVLNYRSKIETIRIEVGDTLGRKVHGHYVSIGELIQNLPRLKDIQLLHSLDEEPYRHLEQHVRWKYPEELFEALTFVPEDNGDPYRKRSSTVLRSWTWNSRLAGELCSLEKLVGVHQTPGFSSLQKLSFVNYQVPSLDIKVADDAQVMEMDLPEIQKMAAAISALPHLEHLVFESSTMVNGPLLNLLPKGLKSLQLINCWDVTAEALQDFLLTHGNSVVELVLDHCQALSLDFLPVLSTACPNLTHLSMNLKYFRPLENAGTAEPFYETLLEAGQVPTWPASLQHLDMQNLRNWGSAPIDTATVFFKSLTDSASKLPHLRYLSLKTMINAPIRERSAFRKRWVEKMDNIFKRRCDDPKPVPRRVSPIQRSQVTESTTTVDGPATPMRRSSRIAERPQTPTTPDEVSVVSQREVANVRRVRKETLRLTGRSYHADDEDSEDELSASGLADAPEVVPIFKQRRCHVVDIQVDNQKIAEDIFTAQDFLDSPPSSDDEDWDGQDMEFN